MRRTGVVRDASEFRGFVGAAGIEWEASPKVRADLQYSRDIYPLLGNNFQDAHLVGGTVHWEVNPRWSVLFRAGWQQSHASLTGDRDHQVTSLFRVGWRPSDRVELAFSWDFRARRAGARSGDFDNNRLGLQFTWSF